MPQVDPAINWSLKQFGFSQVLVVLKKTAAADPSVALATSTSELSGRSNVYLRELPTKFAASAVDIHNRIAKDFNPSSTEGRAALAIAESNTVPVSRSRSKIKPRPEVIKPRPEVSTVTKSRMFPKLGVEWGFVDKGGLSKLSQHEDVQQIYNGSSPASIYPVEVRSARPRKAEWAWGLERLRVDQLRQGRVAVERWDGRELTGEGVRVGHLDTGIDLAHDAFAVARKQGRITFQEFDLDGEPVPGAARDSGRHGTHTAGTICGGKFKKMNFGVAPGVHLFSAMVIEGGSLVRVLSGIEWCLENNVHIINISLGYIGWNPFFKMVMKRVVDLGVIPVVAIGNEGVGNSRSPGNYEEVLSIGAVNRRDEVPEFSSSTVFNRPREPYEPNLVAPGVDILSARAGGGLLSMSGTSMATPHATGCIALLLQAKPGTSPSRMIMALQMSAQPLPKFEKRNLVSRRGYGLINPVDALRDL